jgi:hypothetical protein
MFAYFLAVQPNQEFALGGALRLLFIRAVVLSFIYVLGPIGHHERQIFWLSRLLRFANIFRIVGLGVILFIVLVGVVKVSSCFSGPLRPFN